jgi:hypothetical protein
VAERVNVGNTFIFFLGGVLRLSNRSILLLGFLRRHDWVTGIVKLISHCSSLVAMGISLDVVKSRETEGNSLLNVANFLNMNICCVIKQFVDRRRVINVQKLECRF